MTRRRRFKFLTSENQMNIIPHHPYSNLFKLFRQQSVQQKTTGHARLSRVMSLCLAISCYAIVFMNYDKLSENQAQLWLRFNASRLSPRSPFSLNQAFVVSYLVNVISACYSRMVRRTYLH